MLDFLAFPDNARIWIYQSDKAFPEEKIDEVNEAIQRFSREWTSHNRQLRATGGLLHERFIILVADETQAGASGCSIDTSVRFLKNLESDYNLDLFNRMNFSYLKDGEIKSVPASGLPAAIQAGEVTGETLFFDNLVDNKADYINRWLVPLEKSWINRFAG